jgi:outer membrane protein
MDRPGIKIGLLVLTVMLMLSGCATIKRARQAQNPKKMPAGERTVRASEVGLSAGSDLTLERALEIADKYHPLNVQARQNLVVAEAQAKDALALFVPSITGTAGMTHTETANQSPSKAAKIAGMGGDFLLQDSYGIKFNLDQLLFDFGKTSAMVRQAHFNVVSARERLKLSRNQIAYQVRLAFYALNKTQELEKVAKEQELQFGRQRDQIKITVAVGRATGYDLTKAEVNLGNAHAGTLNAHNAVQTARATLNQAVGLAEDPGYKIVEPAFEDFSAGLEELMKEARDHNPELQALTAEDKMASAVVDQSIAGLFPRLGLTAGLSWTGTKFPLTGSWSLGPALAGTIFDGLRNLRKIDETAAQLKSAHSRMAAKEQGIYLDLSKALAQLENARQQVKVAGEVVRQAKINLDQVQERYKVGRASILEVTDAQLTLTQARSSQVQARYDQESAIALIRLTTGADEK